MLIIIKPTNLEDTLLGGGLVSAAAPAISPRKPLQRLEWGWAQGPLL